MSDHSIEAKLLDRMLGRVDGLYEHVAPLQQIPGHLDNLHTKLDELRTQLERVDTLGMRERQQLTARIDATAAGLNKKITELRAELEPRLRAVESAYARRDGQISTLRKFAPVLLVLLGVGLGQGGDAAWDKWLPLLVDWAATTEPTEAPD